MFSGIGPYWLYRHLKLSIIVDRYLIALVMLIRLQLVVRGACLENRNLRANSNSCSRCLVGNKPEVKNSMPKIETVSTLLPAQ